MTISETENQKKRKTQENQKQNFWLLLALVFFLPRKKLTVSLPTRHPSGGSICKDAFVEPREKRQHPPTADVEP